MVRFRLLFVLTLAAPAACADSSGIADFHCDPPAPARDETPAIQTEALCYTLRAEENGYRATIGYVLTNRSPMPIFFVLYCQGIAAPLLEKRVDTTWVTAWVPVVTRCGAATELPSGGQYRDTLFVSGGYPSNNFYPKFHVDSLPGIYRLNWMDVFSSFDDDDFTGELVPLEQRVSNVFALTLSQ